MKKAVLIISLLAAAFAAFIVIFPDKNPLKKWLKKPATDTDDNNAAAPGSKPAATSQQPAAADSYRLGFPLKQGSKGTYVAAIQAALNKKYFTNLVIDGIFGPKTYRALSVNGFNPDNVTFADYQKLIS